jgi:hypothetical protein
MTHLGLPVALLVLLILVISTFVSMMGVAWGQALTDPSPVDQPQAEEATPAPTILVTAVSTMGLATAAPISSPTPRASPTSAPIDTPTEQPTATPTQAAATPTDTPPTWTATPTPTAARAPTSTPTNSPTSLPSPTPTRASQTSSGGGGGGGGGSHPSSSPSQTTAARPVKVAGAAVAVVQPAPKPPFVPAIPQPAPPAAPAAPDTTTSAPPEFQLGFAFLKQQLGPTMGDPLEPEHGSDNSCDTEQRTTTGLAYFLCSTNTLGFAADPDGLEHWAWVDPLGQLVNWRGGSPDPPTDAQVVSPAAPTGAVLDDGCGTPDNAGATMCRLFDGIPLTGYITTSGQSNTYRFDISASSDHVTADLRQLPADYDLYLADANGVVLAQSVQEGTTPEEVDTILAPGTYYLFVHSDPGRPFDPQDPYTLQLSITPAAATAPETP